LIALAASIILLASNLDNVPDCPELLNLGTKTALLLAAHQAPLKIASPIVAGWEALPHLEDRVHYISDPVLVLAPPCVTRQLYQATDPSPPNA
jgi:hypothetical protein